MKTTQNNEYYHSVTFEKLAHEYIAYIKSIQSKGPYNLFGWSFGGVLALEIAKQLTDRQNRVENLVLIDPYFDYKKVSDKLNIKEFNIHYKYSPLIKSKLNITKILLFKSKILSKKIPEEYPGANSLARHYIKKAKYNHLDNILKEQNIERILLKDTHENWINNHYDISVVCNALKSIL